MKRPAGVEIQQLTLKAARIDPPAAATIVPESARSMCPDTNQHPAPAAAATEQFATGASLGAPSRGAIGPRPFALAAALRFCREFWLRVLMISAAVLVPCFWHPRIEAGDLGSHTYNAWLVQLIQQGRAPGLWLAGQTNNILFDITLSGLGGIVGLRAAEKIVVAAAVLLFFWSAFALVCATSRRVCWLVMPCLAMLAYGWTFQQGFINYYLSTGLAFLGLAFVAGGLAAERALGIVLLPLMWMAHPLGVVLYLAVGGYMFFASILGPRGEFRLLAGSAVLSIGLAVYLSQRYHVLWSGSGLARVQYNGSDQLFLYGFRYQWLAGFFLAFAAICLAVDVASRRGAPGREALRQPFQLYILSLISVLVLPSFIELPQYASPVGLLTERATTVCAVLLCCLLGAMRPRRGHLAGFGAIAAVFFFFLYQDTGKLNRMEQQAERYERILPPGQRVIGTIWPFVGSRILIPHIIDRSCIEQCFSYANYEPASGQFRVRANPGNGIVFTDYASADAAQWGDYVVQPRDLPLFEIYQCSLNMTELCMRELVAGEKNGRVGLHPGTQ